MQCAILRRVQTMQAKERSRRRKYVSPEVTSCHGVADAVPHASLAHSLLGFTYHASESVLLETGPRPLASFQALESIRQSHLPNATSSRPEAKRFEASALFDLASAEGGAIRGGHPSGARLAASQSRRPAREEDAATAEAGAAPVRPSPGIQVARTEWSPFTAAGPHPRGSPSGDFAPAGGLRTLGRGPGSW